MPIFHWHACKTMTWTKNEVLTQFYLFLFSEAVFRQFWGKIAFYFGRKIAANPNIHQVAKIKLKIESVYKTQIEELFQFTLPLFPVSIIWF